MQEEAESLARAAHASQVDRQGQPYVGHLERVAGQLTDPKDRAVAWLHDSVEDTSLTPEALLAKGVPADVVASVTVLTRKANESYTEFIKRIATSGDARAIRVKRADLTDNLRPGGEPSHDRKYQKALKRLEQA